MLISNKKLRILTIILVAIVVGITGIYLIHGSKASSLPNPNNVAIGINQASKLGGSTATYIYNHGVTWTRIEVGDYSPPQSCSSGTNCTWYPSVGVATQEGFNIDLIVGNTSDTSRLDTVNIPNWTASNEAAMADMRARAARQNGSAP